MEQLLRSINSSLEKLGRAQQRTERIEAHNYEQGNGQETSPNIYHYGQIPSSNPSFWTMSGPNIKVREIPMPVTNGIPPVANRVTTCISKPSKLSSFMGQDPQQRMRFPMNIGPMK